MRIVCPRCRREEEVSADFSWRPFCSRRCKIIDLGNWLDEVYRISSPIEGEAEQTVDPRDSPVN